MKEIFKFYPDKGKKPTTKSVFVGALYDFGWIIFLCAVYAFSTYKGPVTPRLLPETFQFYAIVFAVISIQCLFLEFVISWGYYCLKNKKR